MTMDEKSKPPMSWSLPYFCIENVAAKLGVDAERVYQAFTEQSDILNGYIVPEYEVLHTQSREYIVDDLLDVMKEGGESVTLYHGSFLEIAKPDLVHSRPNVTLDVASMLRRCMNRRRSGAASSNAVEKTVLFPGMNMMKAGKLN